MWLHSVGVDETFSHPQQRQQSLHKLWPMRSCKNESHLTCLCETFVYTTSYGAPSKNRWCFDVLKKTRAKDCADGRVHPVARSQSSLHSLRVWSGTNLGFKFPRCLTSPKQFVVILIWKKHYIAVANGLGLYPDYMHIVHLACATDSISSILLDLVEEPNIGINGGTRDQKLEMLWHNYRSWAESAGN